ncbi:MAG: DMT family transporter [Flavobacteriaceae bacterium]|nr:DMT family transporter [Flavobacteriaceae bacterium]
MISRKTALLLAFLAAVIYSLNYTIAKEVMPQYIKPYAFILLRVIGGTLLFWIVSIFIKKEKIASRDYSRIFLASIFGTALNMLSFFKGLSMTSPISASAIMVTTPIIVLILSTIILKERVTKQKLVGIFIGMFGAIILIVYGQNIESSSNAILGNTLILINSILYALYLILINNLTQKYQPLTLAKWLYLFGLFLVIPFGFQEFNEIEWSILPLSVLLKTGYVVVFTTFIAYLFNIIAIKKLKPTTLSIFIYLQPVLATIYALVVGSDSLNKIKIIATILIFAGVYLATRKPKEISQ